MPAVQTTYSDRHRKWVLGQVINMETANSITRIVEEVGGMGFGEVAVKGVADKGILDPDSFAYAAVSAARAGNTGNGTMTANPTTAAGVKAGVYTLTCIEPAANAGRFRLEDPDGIEVGEPTVAVAFAGVLGFTIADGATDFLAGDAFDITVTASAGGGAFEGITIRDITLVAAVGQTVDRYQKGNSAGLLTAGVIACMAGAALVAGNQAYYNPATKRFVASAAGGAYPVPNCRYESSAAADGDLFALRVSAL